MDALSLEFLSEMSDGRRANLSVREAAVILGLSPQRVGFYIRRGDLPAGSINGIDYVLRRRDVERFAEQRATGKRQTGPGRPNPEKLARLRPLRASAARQRARLRQQLRRAAENT